MSKYRMRFSKTGRAIYISHLDLMHTMQRVFSRAGLRLEYSQGFNPHPQISVAMPLSVGIASVCEIMDFSLIEDKTVDDIVKSLMPVLPEGIEIISIYKGDRKHSCIKWLEVFGRLEYDDKETENFSEKLNDLFTAESLVINKKTKRGFADIDVIPSIKSIRFTDNGYSLELQAFISASEPVLNPTAIIDTIVKYVPKYAPDFVKFERLNFYDENLCVFE